MDLRSWILIFQKMGFNSKMSNQLFLHFYIIRLRRQKTETARAVLKWKGCGSYLAAAFHIVFQNMRADGNTDLTCSIQKQGNANNMLIQSNICFEFRIVLNQFKTNCSSVGLYERGKNIHVTVWMCLHISVCKNAVAVKKVPLSSVSHHTD